jgi:pyridoxine 5'-phosphate synthase PdxJ
VAIREIVELNIGHAVVSDSVFVGIRDAVQAYRRAIELGVRAR